MKNILLFTFIISSSLLYAQQEFSITHYVFNGSAINPAYAGVHKSVSASLLYRNQWAGLSGSPKTQFFSINGELHARNSSLGMLVYRDKVGLLEEYSGYFSYAYRVPVSKTMDLSMGLQFSLHNHSIDYSRQEVNRIVDAGDPSLINVNETTWNSGAGILLHSKTFYFGISIPQILNRNFDDSPSVIQRHYYLSTGYAFKIHENLILKPNVLVRMIENAPVQIDWNANLLIKEMLWLGTSYRHNNSFNVLFGVQFNPQFLVSYSTDLAVTHVNRVSHELMVNFIFDPPQKRIVSPRFY